MLLRLRRMAYGKASGQTFLSKTKSILYRVRLYPEGLLSESRYGFGLPLKKYRALPDFLPPFRYGNNFPYIYITMKDPDVVSESQKQKGHQS